VRLGLRNKTGFHECPQCKSRSVWKADPYGALEEALHHFLRLSPYRCARCDKRFMDSKIPVPGAPPRLIRRWLSRASRLMRRTPLDEALRMYSILGPPLPTPSASVAQRLGDRKANRSQPASSETARLGENSGVRA
jgi:DNA-directed RNA polymerase subunit RPC12/RpoP